MHPARAGNLLRAAETSAFLIAHPVHIGYLTGVQLSSGFLLASKKGFFLFVDDRYREAADRDARRGVAVRHYDALQGMMTKVRTCGFECEHVSVARLARWRKHFPNTKFVQTDGVIEEFRRSKEPEELLALARARRITTELLRRVPSALRGGCTERSLAWKLAVWAQELGADRLAFDPIVAFGTHTSSPHHHPTTRPLKKGHIVQVDVGAVYRGYCGDRSAVYFTAKPTPLQQKIHAALQEAKAAGEARLAPGRTNHEADRAARAVLKRYGIDQYFTHALGHGIGLEVHEGVTLSQRSPERKFLKNEVVAIEPGVYFPGRFGMRIEDTVVIR